MGDSKQKNNDDSTNDNGTHVYIAIRRSDGYVGKPQLATDVFAMDAGNSSSTIPCFDSGFPVDFAFLKLIGGTENWYTHARLIKGKALFTDTTDAEGSDGGSVFDSNVGYYKSVSSSYQAFMFKRHAGFDVVTYSGQSGAKTVPHSLGKNPEMMWVKNRTYGDANGWAVYHKGLNGGTNPEQYRIRLQGTNAEDDNVGAWQDTAPTSTHFTLGTDRMVNQSSFNYIAMLFASVDGISKCGYYTGTNSTVTVTTGFQPRFVIIKLYAGGIGNWNVLDTTRGWGSGNDNYLVLNDTGAQGSHNVGAPTSTGFTVDTAGSFNEAGKNYIYYAHA